MPILDFSDFDALIISPKPKMIAWVNQIFPSDPMTDIEAQGHDQSTVYLIPEQGHESHAFEWLEDNFDDIFYEELMSWCTDPALFPPLTWENFKDYCRISYQSNIRVVGSGEEEE